MTVHRSEQDREQHPAGGEAQQWPRRYWSMPIRTAERHTGIADIAQTGNPPQSLVMQPIGFSATRRCGRATSHPRLLRKSATSIETQVCLNGSDVGLLPVERAGTAQDRLQPDRTAAFAQIRLQQFGYTAGSGDDSIGLDQGGSVSSAYRRTSRPLAFEDGFQLPIVTHVVGRGGRRSRHGKRLSGHNRVQSPPPRRRPGV